MFNQEENKREKVKKSKSEQVKQAVQSYLQKRNFAGYELSEINEKQLDSYYLVEDEVKRPNSILYSCYSCDPSIIDNNFSKFLNWLKDVKKTNDVPTDLQNIVAPLFCHFYFEILHSGHPEKASVFFRQHYQAVERSNSDEGLKKLLLLLLSERSDKELITLQENFRSNKYFIQLSDESKKSITNFISKNCHMIFLQVIQKWFDFEDFNEEEEMETSLVPNEVCTNSKFEKILEVSDKLDADKYKNILSINVSNSKYQINCGFLSRKLGLLAYNQDSMVHIKPLHAFNNLIESDTAYDIIQLTGQSTRILSLYISLNYLVCGTMDGKVSVYENKKFEHIKSCVGHLGPIYAVKISSNEIYVASASQDTTMRLWNVSNGQFLSIFIGHEQSVTCLDFHPNCLYLVSGSTDKNIRMWNIENSSAIRLFCGSKGAVRSVSFNPLGQYLVSTGDEKYLRVWAILNGTLIYEVKYDDLPIYKILWSKDGKTLCTASLGKMLRIWDFKKFLDNSSNGVDLLSEINTSDTILNFDYCFGTFACLTSNDRRTDENVL